MMMKRMICWALLAAALGLAGCASGGAARLQPVAKAQQTDSRYVAQVEAIAKRRGVEVRWVHPPREVDRRP